MRVLLTGASGFVGRHLMRRLGKHELFILVRRSTGHPREVIVDLADSGPWSLPDHVDLVVHAAGQIDGEDRDQMWRVNVDATQRLLQWAADDGVKSFLFLSSGAVYGPHRVAVRESQEMNPRGLYAETKAAAEMSSLSFRDRMIVMIARLYFPFGPGQTGRFVPRLLARVLEGQPVAIGESGEPVMTLTYVDDVVDLLTALVQIDQSVTVNVAGDEAISVRSLAMLMGDVVGVAPRFEIAGGSEGQNYIADTTFLRELTQLRPTVGIREGVARTIGATVP